MPESNFFRRIEEKHLSSEVELMRWSPKMDLIAVSLASGEVALHRLSWQRVWTLRPPEEAAEARATALAWRPDGKILAVGYDSGVVALVDVEDASLTHENALRGTMEAKPEMEGGDATATPDRTRVAISSLEWIEISHASDESKRRSSALDDDADDDADDDDEDLVPDDFQLFLQKLSSLAKNQGNLATKKETPPEKVDDGKRIRGQKKLNVLTAGFGRNQVQLFAYGLCPIGSREIVFPDGVLNASERLKRVVDASVSQDLRDLSVVVETEEPDVASETPDGVVLRLRLLTFATPLLVRRRREIRTLALRYGHVLALREYMDGTLKLMSEAWEDILQDMDEKLLMFAEEKRRSGGGSLGVDFLELLLFGVASDELVGFLLHNLTAKGLKKLAHSIESSYANIQKLVLKNLQTVCQALVYHLADLRGMALWEDRFGEVGLDPAKCLRALNVAGGCFLKSCELQQAIDSSLNNFKAFFSWLYVAIQRLSEEAVPPELGKMSMRDVAFVAEFLNENFCGDIDDGDDAATAAEPGVAPASASKKGASKTGFRLERVGQYLKDEPLSFPTPEKNSLWGVFLESLDPSVSESIADSLPVFPSFSTHSILTLNEVFLDAFHDALMDPGAVIGASFAPDLTLEMKRRRGRAAGDEPMTVQWSRPANHETFLAWKDDDDAVCVVNRSLDDARERAPRFVRVKFGYCSEDEDDDSADAEVAEAGATKSAKVADLRAYDQDAFTLLLRDPRPEDGASRLFQLRVADLIEDSRPISPAPDASGAVVYRAPLPGHVTLERTDERRLYEKTLNNLAAAAIAVSGSRKVCCVLFASRRRVALFLTDVLDEEDEEEEEEDEEGVEEGGAQEGSDKENDGVR